MPIVARFLSDEWIAEMDSAARSSTELADLFDGTEIDRLVIEHVVTGASPSDPGDETPDVEAAFHLVLGPGPARAVAGRAADPTITFSQDHATAAAISSGRTSAQAAFMAGRLRIGGRVDLLLAHHGLLADVDDVFAEVRARTEW